MDSFIIFSFWVGYYGFSAILVEFYTLISLNGSMERWLNNLKMYIL